MRMAQRLALAGLSSLAGCDDTTFPAHSTSVSGEGYDAVLQVVEGNCLGCHSAASQLGGLDLETDFCGEVLDGRIVVEGDSAGSVLYQRITSESAPMPQAGLMDQGNIDIVGNWIDDGADCTEGGGDGGAEPTTGPEIYAAACAACHGADGGGVSGPDLGAVVPGLSATDVEAIVSGGSGNMPPISSLSTDQVVTVSAYVVETWGN